MDPEDALQRLWQNRFAAAGLLVVLAAMILWLPFQLEPPRYPPALRFVHLGLPSLAVFAALTLSVWVPPATGRLALAWGFLAYLALGILVLGVLLAMAGQGQFGSAMRASSFLLGLIIWPTLVLVWAGRWLGLVPLPE